MSETKEGDEVSENKAVPSINKCRFSSTIKDSSPFISIASGPKTSIAKNKRYTL